MSSYGSTSRKPDGNRASLQRTFRWSQFYRGALNDPTQPGNEYIAWPIMIDGPSPPRSPVDGPNHPISARWKEGDPPAPKSRVKAVRKLVRKISNALLGRKPKDQDSNKAGKGFRPLFTADTLFEPSTDPQLTFSRPIEEPQVDPNQLPPFVWTESILYCRTCELSYLVGKAGLLYAEMHPHHLAALNNQRSLAVIANANMLLDTAGGARANAKYNFGPGSKYNLEVDVGPFPSNAEAMAYTLRDCLEYIYEEVIRTRHSMVLEDHVPTENLVLQGSDPVKCRIMIFAQLTGAPESIDNTAGEEMKALVNTIDRMATSGIEVKWADLDAVKFPPRYD